MKDKTSQSSQAQTRYDNLVCIDEALKDYVPKLLRAASQNILGDEENKKLYQSMVVEKIKADPSEENRIRCTVEFESLMFKKIMAIIKEHRSKKR